MTPDNLQLLQLALALLDPAVADPRPKVLHRYLGLPVGQAATGSGGQVRSYRVGRARHRVQAVIRSDPERLDRLLFWPREGPYLYDAVRHVRQVVVHERHQTLYVGKTMTRPGEPWLDLWLQWPGSGLHIWHQELRAELWVAVKMS